MPKFCGNCGSRLDERTGACPKCTTQNAVRPQTPQQTVNQNTFNGMPGNAPVIRPVQNNASNMQIPAPNSRPMQSNAPAKPQQGQKKKKDKKSKKPLIALIVILLLVVAVGAVFALSYFGVIKIPFVDKLLGKAENAPVDPLSEYVTTYDDGDKVFHPAIEQLSYDAEARVIYFNNIINVYTFGDLNTEEIQELEVAVDGKVVGCVSGSISMLQIKIKESSYEEILRMSEKLMKFDKVVFADYDFPIEMVNTDAGTDPWNNTPNSPEADRNSENGPNGNDWWAEAIGAYSAWERLDGYDVKTIKVGVVDSGFDLDHEDLTGRLTLLPGYTENSEGDHGTHVTGLIAANSNTVGMRGVADNAQLYCVDWSPVTNDTNSSEYVSYLSVGEYTKILETMIDNGVRVINNSWGMMVYSREKFVETETDENSGTSELLRQYVVSFFNGSYDDYLEGVKNTAKASARDFIMIMSQIMMNGNNDFIIVQSAGNGYEGGLVGKGFDAEFNGFFCGITKENFDSLDEETKKTFSENNISYYTLKEHIIIVGAVKNETSGGNYKMTNFSNFGGTVDICAPGQNIFSTLPSNTYGSMNGTSMSTPIVAGSAALIWGIDPELTAGEVKKMLIGSATVKAVGVGVGKGREYPMLDLGNAVRLVLRKNAVGPKLGNVVEYEGKTYFWKYNKNSFEKSGPLGNYGFNQYADENLTKLVENSLICMDENGNQTTILKYNGVDEIAIVNGKIFFQCPNYYGRAYNKYGISCCNTDGTGIEFVDYGEIEGVTDSGKIVYTKIIDSDDFYYNIYSLDPETLESKKIEDDGLFLTCYGETIFYQKVEHQRTYGKTILGCVNSDGSDNRALYTTANNLYDPDNYYALSDTMIFSPQIWNDYIYYLYGALAGSGIVFQGGKIVRVKLDGTGGEIVDEINMDETYVTSFVINNDGSVSIGILKTEIDEPYMHDEKISIFDKTTLKYVDCIETNDYISFFYKNVQEYVPESETEFITIQAFEIVGEKVYCLMHLNSLLHYTGYGCYTERVKTAMFCKDMATGQVTLLYQFDA